MIFRNIKYFTVQGVKGLLSNSLMTLASIGIVVASLVLFGVFVLLGININSVGEQIKEQCEINVYMPNDMNRDDVRAIGSQLGEIELSRKLGFTPRRNVCKTIRRAYIRTRHRLLIPLKRTTLFVMHMCYPLRMFARLIRLRLKQVRYKVLKKLQTVRISFRRYFPLQTQ